MITAHKKNHGKRLPLDLKRNIGIESLKEKATIVDISNRFNVSRNSVYKQQAIALNTVNPAFEQTDNEILYYIPLTKAYIQRAVTALYLVFRAGSRDIMSFMDLIFDYSRKCNKLSEFYRRLIEKYDEFDMKTCKINVIQHKKPDFQSMIPYFVGVILLKIINHVEM